MDYFPIKESEINGEKKLLNENWIWKVIILESEKFISKAILDLWWEEKLNILWRTKDKEIDIPENAEIVKAENLSNISEIDKNILEKVIICEKSKRPFRFIKWEINFYKKMWLPLPKNHYDIRHQERNKNLSSRNLEIWECDKTWEKIIFSKKWTKWVKIYSKKSYEKEIY